MAVESKSDQGDLGIDLTTKSIALSHSKLRYVVLSGLGSFRTHRAVSMTHIIPVLVYDRNATILAYDRLHTLSLRP